MLNKAFFEDTLKCFDDMRGNRYWAIVIGKCSTIFFYVLGLYIELCSVEGLYLMHMIRPISF